MSVATYNLVFSPGCINNMEFASILGSYPSFEAAQVGLLKFLSRPELKLDEFLSDNELDGPEDEYNYDEPIVGIESYHFPFLDKKQYESLLAICTLYCFCKLAEETTTFRIVRTTESVTYRQIRRFIRYED